MALYHSSNVLGRANKDAPWEIWRGPRFASCKLASHKPVTAHHDGDGDAWPETTSTLVVL
jgi:hypothetical protein